MVIKYNWDTSLQNNIIVSQVHCGNAVRFSHVPGFHIYCRQPVTITDVLGVLAVWRQRNKKRNREWGSTGVGCVRPCLRWVSVYSFWSAISPFMEKSHSVLHSILNPYIPLWLSGALLKEDCISAKSESKQNDQILVQHVWTDFLTILFDLVQNSCLFLFLYLFGWIVSVKARTTCKSSCRSAWR